MVNSLNNIFCCRLAIKFINVFDHILFLRFSLMCLFYVWLFSVTPNKMYCIRVSQLELSPTESDAFFQFIYIIADYETIAFLWFPRIEEVKKIALVPNIVDSIINVVSCWSSFLFNVNIKFKVLQYLNNAESMLNETSYKNFHYLICYHSKLFIRFHIHVI